MADGASSVSVGVTTADPVAAAHARLLQDPALQFGFDSVELTPPPDWLKPLLEVLAAIAPILTWIFWGALALAAAGILWFILRELIRLRWPHRRRTVAAAEPEAWRPQPAQARALLDEADRLAAEGRYADAARLLLHRSIEDLEQRRPRTVRPALTARDIARLDSLPAAARPAFHAIAEVVERSAFGGRPVDAPGFEACRNAYEAFAFPEAWA